MTMEWIVGLIDANAPAAKKRAALTKSVSQKIQAETLPKNQLNLHKPPKTGKLAGLL